MNVWQLQEAKNKFSKLVEAAISNGPQIVTKHGIESVVVLSKKEYADLSKKKKPLIDILKSAPTVDLDVSRSKESPHSIPSLRP